MLLVVDIGCARHNAEESVYKLIETYHPDRLIGFDPHPSVVEGEQSIDGTQVFLNRAAAWVYDGLISYLPDAAGSRVGQGFDQVECFDLVTWLRYLTYDGNDVVIKFDCEGAEYRLLDVILAAGLDRKLDEILVEWHNASNPREPMREEDIQHRDALLAKLKPKKCVRSW